MYNETHIIVSMDLHFSSLGLQLNEFFIAQDIAENDPFRKGTCKSILFHIFNNQISMLKCPK